MLTCSKAAAISASEVSNGCPAWKLRVTDSYATVRCVIGQGWWLPGVIVDCQLDVSFGHLRCHQMSQMTLG